MKKSVKIQIRKMKNTLNKLKGIATSSGLEISLREDLITLLTRKCFRDKKLKKNFTHKL